MKSRYQQLKRRFEELADQYGPVALGVHLVGFALVMTGSTLAIQAGAQFESAAGLALIPAAYAVTKLTSPVRILVTIALTPPVAKLLGRAPSPSAPPATDEG